MNNQKNYITGSATTTILGAVVILVAFLYLLVRLATTGSGYYNSVDDMTEQAISTRIKTQGSLTMGDGVPEGQRTGEMVFNKVCIQCHGADSATANSPKITHNAEWAPRIAKGMPTLLDHAVNGFNAMPARGGNPSLTDDELARAIAHMANESGGNLSAPAIQATASEEGASEVASAQ